jgi:hypothetical protein
MAVGGRAVVAACRPWSPPSFTEHSPLGQKAVILHAYARGG